MYGKAVVVAGAQSCLTKRDVSIMLVKDSLDLTDLNSITA